MNAFQVILVSVLGVAAALVASLLARGAIGRVAGCAGLLVAAGGIVFAIKPDWTTEIAHLLGISRGTDLLVYLLVLVVMYGFLFVYLKLRRVRRELTLLVRELAVREAERREEPRADRDAPADRTR
jgi:hypothetical protein